MLWMLYFPFSIVEFLQYRYALHSSYFTVSLIFVLIMVKKYYLSREDSASSDSDHLKHYRKQKTTKAPD